MSVQPSAGRVVAATVLLAMSAGCKHADAANVVAAAIVAATVAQAVADAPPPPDERHRRTEPGAMQLRPAPAPVVSKPVAGPVKPGRQPAPVSGPSGGGSKGGRAGTSIVVTGGAHVGPGAYFPWSLGVSYRPRGDREPAPGSTPVGPAVLELLGSWPAGAAGEPALASVRGALLDVIADAKVGLDVIAPALGAGAVEPIVWALQEAADRGVHVRVLTAAGVRSAALEGLAARRGVEVREVAQAALGLSLLVADRGLACLPGAAFRGNARGAELAAVASAPSTVRAIEDVFEREWARAVAAQGPQSAPPLGGYKLPEEALLTSREAPLPAAPRLGVRPLFAPAGSLPSEALAAAPALVALIDSARATLRIYAPWASAGRPDAEVVAALGRAADRGVRIKVLDVRGAANDLAGLEEIEELQLRRAAGEGQPLETLGLMVADRARSWIGSGGLAAGAHRSAGLAVDGAAMADVLNAWFDAAWSDAPPALSAR